MTLKNLRIFTLTALLLAGAQANSFMPPAACYETDSAERVPVVFFGGNHASQDDGNNWAEATDKAVGTKFSSRMTLTNMDQDVKMPDPQRKRLVVKAASRETDACIDTINDTKFKGPIALVGHSDGGWALNEIAKKLGADAFKKVKIVSLDGYYDAAAMKPGLDFQCWTSYNADIQTNSPQKCGDVQDNAKSMYTDEMKKCGSACHLMPVHGCKAGNKWCLHFKLVNSNASPDLSAANFPELGYKNDVAPLPFLENWPVQKGAPRAVIPPKAADQ